MLEKLDEIIADLMFVENGLLSGEIPFSYDRLMMALKPGHPAEILDGIVSEIFWDIQAEKVPETQKIVNVYNNLEGFMEAFKVDDLAVELESFENFFAEFDINIDDYMED